MKKERYNQRKGFFLSEKDVKHIFKRTTHAGKKEITESEYIRQLIEMDRQSPIEIKYE